MKATKRKNEEFDSSDLWDAIESIQEAVASMDEKLDVFMEDTAADVDGFRAELAALGDRIRKMERNTVPLYHRHTTMGITSSEPLDF